MTQEEFDRRLADCEEQSEELARRGIVQFDGDEGWSLLMRDLAADAVAEAEKLIARRRGGKAGGCGSDAGKAQQTRGD